MTEAANTSFSEKKNAMTNNTTTNSSVTASPLPNQMSGVQLIGHGGLDKLVYKTDLAIPTPKADEVLIRVKACGVNNTDINTRIGWYSKGVTGQTNSGGKEGFDSANDDDATWSGKPMELPRIQGADCCGEVVAVGAAVNADRLGERVLVRSMQSLSGEDEAFDCFTFGSECDGGFAQYAAVRANEVFAVNSTMTDAELASFPCAYSTAENMIDRAQVKAGDTVLITGASGGVGSAAVQLAKRRNAKVIAVCGADKMAQLAEIGADQQVRRGDNLIETLGKNSVDVVIDLVAGPQWPELLEVIKVRGRYAVAGAIAGPIVDLDVRTLYLKDLTFFGCTFQPRHVFENLIRYIEQGEIHPLVAQTFPLQEIQQAQQVFLDKQFMGKLVLLPE